MKGLGSDASQIDQATTTAYVSLVMLMYLDKLLPSLDDMRYKMFAKNNSANEKLPPTTDSFQPHLKRANYQSYIWMHATTQFMDITPVNNG